MSENKESIKDTALEVNALQVEGYTDGENWDKDISNVKIIALGCLAVIMVIFTLSTLIMTIWAA